MHLRWADCLSLGATVKLSPQVKLMTSFRPLTRLLHLLRKDRSVRVQTIRCRHQWVPKVTAQRKIRHPPPRLLFSNSTSPLIIQSYTNSASTQTIYRNFVIICGQKEFLYLCFFVCYKHGGRGVAARETHPNQGITQ